MQILIENYQRLLDQLPDIYPRSFYDDFVLENRLMGIVGARGVGKTTFLLHYLKQNYSNSSQAFYFPADHLYLNEHTLLDIADQFVKQYNGQILCIDEIHKYKNWNQELKNIYDSFPQLSVIFSGSSSIDLVKGKYDLSRRAILKKMFGFSFREFLEIKTDSRFDTLQLEDLLANHLQLAKSIANTPRLLGHLDSYLRTGYYPMALNLDNEDVLQQSLLGVVDKIVFEDISNFYSLKTQNLDSFKKILYFLATSPPGSININRLAQSIGKDHSTISDYLQMLRDTGLLRFLLNDKNGHALVRNAEKVYLDNTNLLYAINHTIGKQTLSGVVREIFVISSMQNAGYQVFYSPQGDLICQNSIFEIGGKNKTNKQLAKAYNAFMVKDDILIGEPKSIPMYLFGFLS